MRFYTVLILALALSSCGRDDSFTRLAPTPGVSGTPGLNGQDGTNGQNGASGVSGIGCTVEPVAPSDIEDDQMQYGGAIITCANGSVFISNGAPGAGHTNNGHNKH